MKSIKLLLTETVPNLGIVGDVVTVKTGYARNYLVPRGMVTSPTQGNVNRLAEQRNQAAEELCQIRQTHEILLEKLQEHELTIQRSANEQGVLFGGVSQHDIAESLRENGFAIEDRFVHISQQIKRLDTYSIPIVLADDLRTEIKLWVVSDKPAEELESTSLDPGSPKADPEISEKTDNQE